MRSRNRVAGLALVAIVVLGLSLAVAPGEAATYPQNKYFFGYTDFHEFGDPYSVVQMDCFKITENAICSFYLGCGTFQIVEEVTPTMARWKAVFPNSGWLAGGKVEVNVGFSERRGLGGSISAVGYARDKFYSPTARYGITLEGAGNRMTCEGAF